ncbi:MAG TPA: DivIVA domain-containing protein [Micromonosporaceae bacterium]
MTTLDAPPKISASAVRTANFPISFRGYRPAAVHAFLRQVAEEIIDLHRRLAAANAECDRIKQHLKQWQRDHAATCRQPDDEHRRRRDHWPVNREPTYYVSNHNR